MGRDSNGCGKSLAEDFDHFLDKLIGLEQGALDWGTAGKGQNLFDNPCGALGAEFQVGQNFAAGRIAGLLLQTRHANQDGRKNVVEVVSNAADQGTDALQSLGALELGFEPYLFRPLPLNLFPGLFASGHVDHRAHHSDGASFGIAHHASAVEHIGNEAVLAKQGIFVRPILPVAGEDFFDALEHTLKVVRMGVIQPRALARLGGFGVAEMADGLA